MCTRDSPLGRPAPEAGAFASSELNRFFHQFQLPDQMLANVPVANPEDFGTALKGGLLFRIELFPHLD